MSKLTLKRELPVHLTRNKTKPNKFWALHQQLRLNETVISILIRPINISTELNASRCGSATYRKLVGVKYWKAGWP